MSMASFHTRHYQSATGLESANWVFNTVQDIATSTGHPSVTVSKYNHTFAQFSVIAKFQGSDATLPSIIIGAHQDSIAGGLSGRSPGADDNASGCVTLFDAFRILALNGFNPKATVEFHFYAGEEAGLLGSRAIANAYRDQGLKVAGMLNYDVVGYAGPSGGRRNIFGKEIFYLN
jgi:leucyl aminopeptidase